MSKKGAEENKVITKLSNVWEFLGYALRYRAKELMALVIVGLIALIVVMNKGHINKLIQKMIGE